jgi:hypothetical protein
LQATFVLDLLDHIEFRISNEDPQGYSSILGRESDDGCRRKGFVRECNDEMIYRAAEERTENVCEKRENTMMV